MHNRKTCLANKTVQMVFFDVADSCSATIAHVLVIINSVIKIFLDAVGEINTGAGEIR